MKDDGFMWLLFGLLLGWFTAADELAPAKGVLEKPACEAAP